MATVKSVTATVVNGTDLQLDCTVFMETETPPTPYRVAARIQLASVGCGKNSGLMRSFISRTVGIRTHQEASDSGTFEMIVRFHIPDYQSIWHVDGRGLQMYSKFFLIDQVTGYRKIVNSQKYFFQLSNSCSDITLPPDEISSFHKSRQLLSIISFPDENIKEMTKFVNLIKKQQI